MMVSYRLNMSRSANLSVFVGIGRRGGPPDFHWGLRSVGQLRSILKNESPSFSLHSWQHFDDDPPWQLAMKQTPLISAAEGFDRVVAQIVSTPSKKDRRAESLTDEKWNSRKNENRRGPFMLLHRLQRMWGISWQTLCVINAFFSFPLAASLRCILFKLICIIVQCQESPFTYEKFTASPLIYTNADWIMKTMN